MRNSHPCASGKALRARTLGTPPAGKWRQGKCKVGIDNGTSRRPHPSRQALGEPSSGIRILYHCFDTFFEIFCAVPLRRLITASGEPSRRARFSTDFALALGQRSFFWSRPAAAIAAPVLSPSRLFSFPPARQTASHLPPCFAGVRTAQPPPPTPVTICRYPGGLEARFTKRTHLRCVISVAWMGSGGGNALREGAVQDSGARESAVQDAGARKGAAQDAGAREGAARDPAQCRAVGRGPGFRRAGGRGPGFRRAEGRGQELRSGQELRRGQKFRHRKEP